MSQSSDSYGSVLAIGHRTRLGSLGEQLAMESLCANGFQNVRDLNKVRPNNVFADIAAERNGISYIISVKARNRLTKKGTLNNSYNLLKVSAIADAKLKTLGYSTDQITRILYDEIGSISIKEKAAPAWVAVSIDTISATFSAYFGQVGDLRMKRSIPMTAVTCAAYEALATNVYDARITPDLSNASD